METLAKQFENFWRHYRGVLVGQRGKVTRKKYRMYHPDVIECFT